MKRIIALFVLLCYLFGTVQIAQADELLQAGESDFIEFDDLDSDLVDIVHTNTKEREIYVVSDSKNNRIDIYDENGNWLMSGSEITLINVPKELFFVRNDSIKYLYNGVIPCGVADNYDYWGSWQSSDIVRLKINYSVGELKADALTELRYYAFENKKIAIAYLAVEKLVNLIMYSVSNNLVIYLKGDHSYNTYCSILRKERVNRYNFSGSVMTYGTAVAQWLSSPWTYGVYPDACRYLTQLY